jgi:hypothetical protein
MDSIAVENSADTCQGECESMLTYDGKGFDGKVSGINTEASDDTSEIDRAVLDIFNNCLF